MNNIDSTISDEDYIRAKKRISNADRAHQILDSLENAAPFGTTFLHDIPEGKKKAVEAELKHQFELWANSWIAPACREIIAKESKNKWTAEP